MNANIASLRSRGVSAFTSSIVQAVVVFAQPQAAATDARSVDSPVWLR